MPSTHGLHRLVTFVDAIVAIAITLLILPLVDIAGEVHGTGTSDAAHVLAAHKGQAFAFLLSFVVIARLWAVHHSLFERVRSYDGALMYWSLGWALTIVFLPFPTQLTAETNSDRLVLGLYIGTMTLSSACLAVLAMLIARRPALHAGAEAYSPVVTTVTTACFAVALVLAVATPRIGSLWLLLLLLSEPIVRLWRRRHPLPAAPAAGALPAADSV